MSSYRIGLGHDVPLIDLDPFVPQPRSEGMQVARRDPAADGTVIEEARFIPLVWDVFDTVAEYQAVLTLSGLLTARTALVTVYVPDEVWNWVRMNGIAVRPEVGRDIARQSYFLRNAELLVKNLEPAA